MDTRAKLFGVQNSFAVIMVGTVIALIMGLGIQILFSSPELSEEIESKVKAAIPGSEVELGRSGLNLANGIMPDFSILLDSVKIKSLTGCMNGAEFSAESLRIPFRLSSLVFGGAHWGHIQIRDIVARLPVSARSCFGARTSSRQKSPIQRVSQVKRRLDFSPLQKSSHWVRGLRFDRLTVVVLEKELAVIKNFSANFGRESSEIFMLASFDESLTYGETFPDVVVRGTTNYKTLDLQFDGRWREGVLGLEVFHDLEANRLDFDLAFRHIPIAPLTSLAKKMGQFEQEFQSNNLWATCALSVSSEPEKLHTAEWLVKKCELVGKVAEIAVEQVDYIPKGRKFKPFRIDVGKIDLTEFLSAIQKPHPTPSLGQLGQVSGVIRVDDHHNASFIGKWNNLELIFSNRGARKSQLIESFDFVLNRTQKSLELTLKNILPKGGSVNGELYTFFDRPMQKGFVDLEFKEIVLSEEIQKLLAQGSLSPISAQGRIEISRQEVASSDVQVALDLVDGQELLVEGVRLRVQKTGQNWIFDTKISKLELKGGSNAHASLLPLVTAARVPGDMLFTDVAGRFVAESRKKMNWEKFAARLGTARVTTRGGWSESGELQGRVSIKSGGKVVNYRLAGNRDRPEFRSTVKQVSNE